MVVSTVKDTKLIDGVLAAADREQEFHPTRLNLPQSPITAWERRAATLVRHAEILEKVQADLAEVKALLPFPASS